MKKLFAIILVAISSPVFAVTHHINMPPWLDGATITVTLKNGTQYHFSSNQYAVVPRDQTTADPEVPTKPKQLENPNSIRVYGGYGPSGLVVTNHHGSGITIKQGYDVVYGLGYGRKLTSVLSLDSVMLINRDGVQGGMLGMGYSW